MGHWNYRIVEFPGSPDLLIEPYLQICEVYYDEAGAPNGYCDADVGGDTLEELRENYRMLADALEKPLLPVGAMTGRRDDDEDS